MNQENFTDSDDLTQIVAQQRSSAQLLEQLETINPEFADDLAEIRERMVKTADDLEEINKREQEKFDENTSEN